jgi:hypothetical protein
LEFWWNPQKIFQARGRIDRIDQKNNIFIYMLCYNDGSEEIISEEKIYYETMDWKSNELIETYKEKKNAEQKETKETNYLDKVELSEYEKDRFPRLPDIKYFLSLNNFNCELTAYLEDIYGKYPPEIEELELIDNDSRQRGKPLEETRKEIKSKFARMDIRNYRNPYQHTQEYQPSNDIDLEELENLKQLQESASQQSRNKNTDIEYP